MLICSYCEFENPDHNKFCQRCGTSLQKDTSDRNNLSSSLTKDYDSNNGHYPLTTLWAIVTQAEITETELDSDCTTPQSDHDQGLQITDLEIDKSNLQLKTKPNYLDEQNRYCLQEHGEPNSLQLDQSDGDSYLIQAQVIDERPEHKTNLASLQQQQPDLFDELGENLNKSYLSVTQYWNLIGIPTQALPYLVLQKFTPIVPHLYDAWEKNGQGVVILPDRSQLQLLTELWSDPELPFLQILWSLNEIARLWTCFAQVGCSQSLLIETNLRVDEDQSLCLQKLYLDQPQEQPSLEKLAQTWQLWLTESERQQCEELNQLLHQVILGEINTIEQLSTALQQISAAYCTDEQLLTVNDQTIISSEDIFDEDEFSTTDTNNFFADLEADEEDIIYETDLEEQPTIVLPMQLASVTDASGTDIGIQRDHNEDFFGVKTRVTKQENSVEKLISVSGLYIVCDGMGGHAGGEVASAMAVDTLEKYFETHWQDSTLPDGKTIEDGILLANQTIYQQNLDNSRSGNGRMGTTLVMALLQDTDLAIAHVGDSRIYQITKQRGLEQLTQDHEVGQREINRGVEPDIAYGRPDAYQLTQALGPRENRHIKPEIKFLEIQEDCLILLCSDGLCDHDLVENHWETYLTPLLSSSANLEAGLFQLIDFANEYNGHDNITGILVRIKLKPTL